SNEFRGSLRDGAGGDVARQAGRPHGRAAQGAGGAAARGQPDGCVARQHRRGDPEEAGGRQRQAAGAGRHGRQEEIEPLTRRDAEGQRAALAGTVAFTGRLASMKRADAFALVRQHGGKPREGVTRQTDVLIVGALGWPLLDDGRPSNSLAQAQAYKVPIASEKQFLEWLGRSAPEEQTKSYTPEQLASLSKLPPAAVDQLAMFGLVEPRDGHYGFRDLAAARQVAGLLAAGTPLSVITRS